MKKPTGSDLTPKNVTPENGNPAEDVKNTRKIRYVIRDGRLVFDATDAA